MGCFLAYSIIGSLSVAFFVQALADDQALLRKLGASANSILIQPCLFYNRDGGDLITFDYSKGGAAFELAVEYAKDNIIPENVIIDIRYFNLGHSCEEKDTSVHQALRVWMADEQCDVYIGPGCTEAVEHLYDIADYFKTPLIAMTGAGVGAKGDLKAYPYLSRISVTHTMTSRIILKFLRLFSYSNVVFLTDLASSFNVDLYNVLLRTLRQQGSTSLMALKFPTFSSLPGVLEDYTQNLTFSLLRDASLSARVIFLFMRGPIVRDFLISAAKMNMTSSEYVFLAVELYTSAEFGNFTWSVWHDEAVTQAIYGNSEDKIAQAAFESLLLMTYPPVLASSSEEFERQVRKRSPKYGYHYKPTDKIDVIVGHWYDAFIFYASVLQEVAANGISVSNSEAVMTVFNSNFSFFSPLNGLVQMDENGDRQMDYAMKKFSVSSDRFLPFLLFPYSQDNVTIVSDTAWKERDSLPPNSPRCGFDGSALICKPNKAAWAPGTLEGSIIGPLLFFGLAIAGAIYAIKRFAQSQVDPYWWRVFMFELLDIGDINRTRSQLGSHAGSRQGSAKLGQSNASSLKNKSMKSERSEISAGHSLMADTLALASMEIAVMRGNVVCLQDLPDPKLRALPSYGKDLHPLRNLQHNNVQSFLGIGVNDENICQYAIGELCGKGNLPCLLQSKSVKLDEPFKNSLITDLVSGMVYLHSVAALGSHGDLRDTSCLIDSRFVLKVSGHGLAVFRNPADFQPPFDHQVDRNFYPLLWRAPELLRGSNSDLRGTLKGDVYSFAVIIQQIVLKTPPYGIAGTEWDESGLKAKDIVLEVKRGIVPPVRPRVPRSICQHIIVDLVEDCWNEDPVLRPTFVRIQGILRNIPGFSRDNVIDHLFKRMEQYAGTLEQQVEEKTKRFMDEKRRGEEILSGLLPKFVARMLNKGHSIAPETFPSVTIYFSHLEGFDDMIAATNSPAEMTLILNSFYVACDSVIETMDVYKVETVGDAYMVVSGLPVPNGSHHADIISAMSITLMEKIRRLTFPTLPQRSYELRIGINSGPCVAGIIGLKLPRYCLFGDTVNVASRMESSGEAGKIHISSTTQHLLSLSGHFIMDDRGEMKIKGKGMMQTYWLRGYRESVWFPGKARPSIPSTT
ncbi:Atrial natriuretic peptide receptor 2 [Hypsibius exemplaris]|uniref:Guanylate cyclase n=1 Tax=Hypsibius exemplaris TaxID=2072580 RepID=A0A1W0WK94_HYPEX|nr:Atrial natriuretic peptide receptor 2 [Hypsibius exemplaris]